MTTIASTISTTLLPLSTSKQDGEGEDSLGRIVQLISFAELVAISAIGSIGNSVVLYVYSQKKDKQTANIFIISLAVSDMIACTLVIPMTLGMELSSFHSHMIVCKLYYLVNASGIPFSCMLMSAIAVDRYFCICRPFLRAITIPRAKAIVLCLGGLAVTLGLTTATFCSGVVAQTGPNFTWEYANHGHCKEINDINNLNTTTLHVSDASLSFFHVFQKVHVSLFGICIALVVSLYVCIYRSVLEMRRKRRELKGQTRLNAARKSCSPGEDDAAQAAPETTTEDQVPATADTIEGSNDNDASSSLQQQQRQQQQQQQQLQQIPIKKRRRSILPSRESDALQNLKTAAMLFVVTIVFACTFVPATLMTVQLVPFNLLVFYLYYMAHATNPLIYCFMNQNFRDDLRKISAAPAGQTPEAGAELDAGIQAAWRPLGGSVADTKLPSDCGKQHVNTGYLLSIFMPVTPLCTFF